MHPSVAERRKLLTEPEALGVMYSMPWSDSNQGKRRSFLVSQPDALCGILEDTVM